MKEFLWDIFQCTSILFGICCFATEVQRLFFSLGGLFWGESIRVDAAVSEETIPIGGDFFWDACYCGQAFESNGLCYLLT